VGGLLRRLVVILCVLGIGLGLLSSCSPAVLPLPQRPAAGSSPVISGIATRLTTTLIPTSGCGHKPPISAGSSASQALQVAGLKRQYRLHLPVGYDPSRWHSLVLVFHGHDSTAALFEQLTRFSTMADAEHFIAVFPQGSVGPDGRTGWNTSRAKDPAVNDLLFVSQLLSHLQSQLCVDPARIYAAGFSNGGGFTAILACRFAGRIAAFASVSGEYYPQPGGCHPARPVPILEIHGTSDGVVPYQGSRRLHYPSVSAWLSGWALRDGCRAGPVTFFLQRYVTGRTWTQCRGSGEVVQYTIQSGWHVWPDSLSRRPLPAPDAHFAATQVIWSFFAHRALPLP
jgi:polyhydroxybutyrate depolymerase